jgi:hypothetical protein
MSAKLAPTFADRVCRVVSATISMAVNLGYLDPEPLLFHWISSSVILTRLSGPRSRPNTNFHDKMLNWYREWCTGNIIRETKIVSRTPKTIWINFGYYLDDFMCWLRKNFRYGNSVLWNRLRQINDWFCLLILSRVLMTCDWWLDLLYTHRSWLHVRNYNTLKITLLTIAHKVFTVC